MALISASGFLDALREYHILDAAQLEKMNRVRKGREPEPRALARELLNSGWITAYQANQLLQGRGAELVLGPYLLLERLGEGGMGEVFKARHQLMNRTVALKIIRKERLAYPEAVQRFHREIRLAAQLDHPHLVRAHDAAQVGGLSFLVMEFAEGADLHRLVQKSGPLPVGQACLYVRQAALGLQHAHERGLVHRDIKPSNLQATDEGRTVKVLDMGLARSQTPDANEDGKTELTQAHSVMGTPDFIAPEQIDDPRKADARTDIYSLGCTFYYLLAGRPPFPDGAWEEKLFCHRKIEPQPIEQRRPDVPLALGTVLRKMMAKRPEDRFPTCAAVAETLAPFRGIARPMPVMTDGRAGPQTPTNAGPLTPPQAMPAPQASHSATYSAGWTLDLPPSVASAPGQDAPMPQATALLPPTARSSPQHTKRKRLWPITAGSAGLALLVLLLVVFWPKSASRSKHERPKVDRPLAENPQAEPVREDSEKVLYRGKPAKFWAEQLNSDDVIKKHNALTALEALGRDAKEAVPQLIPLLKDQNYDLRTGAARVLAKIGSDAVSAVPALIETLESPPLCRGPGSPAYALGEIGPSAKAAVPALENALKNELVLPDAAAALGKIDPQAKADAVSRYIKELKDRDVEFRVRAARILGELGPEAKIALPALREAEKDESFQVQQMARVAVQKLQQHR